MKHPANFINLKNIRFGKLLVIEQEKPTNPKFTAAYWLCRCDCGILKKIAGGSLRKGITISCGCHGSSITKTHGMSNTRTYNIWEGIKERCLNPKRKEYKNYGGRGISICARWHKFEHFYADMGAAPDGLCIDRKDNNGDYCPENCRWVTREQNNNNHRRNVNIIINNETKTVSQWCFHYGVNPTTAFVRILRGWDKIKAVSTKPHV